MNRRTKLRFGKIISPAVIVGLKIHTTLTGAERARIIVVNERNEVLLVRGVIGTRWSLPGGGVEKNETQQEAAVRELYEETGIRLTEQKVELVGVIQGRKSRGEYVAHLFAVTINSDLLPEKPFNPREIIELEWFPVSKLPANSSPLVNTGLDLLSKQSRI